MEIKKVSRDFYLGKDGVEHQFINDARWSFIMEEIVGILSDGGGTHLDFDVYGAANALRRKKKTIIDLLGSLDQNFT